MEGIQFQTLTPKEEAAALLQTESSSQHKSRQNGDVLYLISDWWFQQWLKYVGYKYDEHSKKLVPVDEPSFEKYEGHSDFSCQDGKRDSKRPGPIDNTEILETELDPRDLTEDEARKVAPLKPNMKEKEHFWVLSQESWGLLVDWYGCCNGSEISRPFVPVGAAQRLEVDPYCKYFKVFEEDGRSTLVPALNNSSILEIKQRAIDALSLKSDSDQYLLMSWPGQKEQPRSLEANLEEKVAFSSAIVEREALLLRKRIHSVAGNIGGSTPTEPIEIPQQTLPGSKKMLLDQSTTASKVACLNGGQIVSPDRQRHNTSEPIAMEKDEDESEQNNVRPAKPLTISTTNENNSHIGSLHDRTPNSLSNSETPTGSRFGASSFCTSPTFFSNSPLSRSFGRAPIWAEDIIVEGIGKRPGLAGLGNLGNTCFMNSSLQCLVHTVPLIKTFLTGNYKSDLNRDNPLGLGGKLASAYGGLMNKLWRGNVSHVSPKFFKWQLGKFAPQFGGYAQQDSQELLAFLLDGLHEDLNRIMDKPYKEEKDSDGRPDAELAAEAWENYRARNDSVVVDNFQGLYKSSLMCPKCGRESVKFDPFMYLSVPLPSSQMRTLGITVADSCGEFSPTNVEVDVPKNGTIRNVVKALDDELSNDYILSHANAPLNTQTPIAADDRWSLVSWGQEGYSYWKDYALKLFNDLETPVSFLPEPSKSLFSFRSSNAAQIIAWRTNKLTEMQQIQSDRNPSTECITSESAANFRQIIVFHRREGSNSSHLCPPTIIFVSEEEYLVVAEGIHKSEDGNSWIVSGHAMDILGIALENALKPFIKKSTYDSSSDLNLHQSLDLKSPVADKSEVTDMSAESCPSVSDKRTVGKNGPNDMELDLETQENVASMNYEMKSCFNEEGRKTGKHALPSATDLVELSRKTNDEGLEETNKRVKPTLDFAEKISRFGKIYLSNSKGNRYTLSDAPESLVRACQKREASSGSPNNAIPASSQGNSIDNSAMQNADNAPLYILAEWIPEGIEAMDDFALWKTPRTKATPKTSDIKCKKVSLTDCVDAFCQRERLDASDSWYCSRCKNHVCADKKLDLWTLPEILVVHLKRFSYSRFSRDKLDTLVDFPLSGLDLRQYVPVTEGGLVPVSNKDGINMANSETNDGKSKGDTKQMDIETSTNDMSAGSEGSSSKVPIYDLYAVSNHYGSMGGGHYTAFVRMPDDELWYTFDDSGVYPMSESQVKSSGAYVLFYRRRGDQTRDSDLIEIINAASTAESIPFDGRESIDVGNGGFSETMVLSPRHHKNAPNLEQVGEEDEECIVKSESEAGSPNDSKGNEKQSFGMLKDIPKNQNSEVTDHYQLDTRDDDSNDCVALKTAPETVGAHAIQVQESIEAHALPLCEEDVDFSDV